MAKKRVCIVCRANPPELPDRNRMGRPIKRICRECHAKRLQRDFRYIYEMSRAKNEKNNL